MIKKRSGLVRVFAVGCCLALAASAAYAQPQRGPGGGGPGGGGPGGPPGGFGGGAMFGGAFGGLAEVLRREDVRKELELLDDQVAQLQKLAEGRRDQMRDLFSGLRDVPQEQRGEKMRELFQKAQKDIEAEVGKILLPHQMKRAKQLEMQLRLRGGLGRMNDQAAQDLGLTDDQKEQLRAKSDELEDAIRKKLAALRAEAQDELLKTLTPAQQAKWKEMVGEPFEFQMEPRPQGGPPGGQPGQAPAGRGRRGGNG